MIRRIIPAAFVLLAAAFSFYSCFGPEKKPATEKSPYLNHDPKVTYVGKETCRQCHSDIYDSFIKTGMGQSFDHAGKMKSAARFSPNTIVYDTFANMYYHPFWDGDSLKFVEFRLKGRDTVFKRIETIKYIVGSGQHTNSHIYEVNGFLYQAPLTWYSQQGRWDLPPGFEHGQNSHFNRVIGLECMSCHNSLPGFNPQSENKFESLPNGISCERCHGPGSLHVEEKKAGKIVDITKEADQTIVNPSRLPWNLQIDVCQRCHLQGNAVLKKDKTFYDFRPGMKLSEVMEVYMPMYEGDNTQFIMASHAERLQKSPCFLKSNQTDANGNPVEGGALKFTCITCHNPHVSVKVTGVNVFNDACKKCHSGNQDSCSAPLKDRMQKQNNCVSCHMQRSGTVDIPHVTVHDHYIRKPVKEEERSAIQKFVGIACINNKKDPSTRAEAYINYHEKFDSKVHALDSAQYYLTKDDPDNLPLQVRISFLKEDYDHVITCAKKMNVEKMEDAWTCYRIGESFFKKKIYNDAEKWLDKAVTLRSYNLDFLYKQGIIKYTLNKQAEAKTSFEKLLSLNPKYALAWCSLGVMVCDHGKGDVITANEYYDKALALEPDLKLALLSKIDLYNFLGDEKKFKDYLERYHKVDPNNAELQSMYSKYHLAP